MSDELYQRARKLYLEVCDLDATARQAILERECKGDPELRAEVESLLRRREPPTATVPLREPPSPIARSDDKEPHQIGPYRIIREQGRGGMGVVYVGVREGDQFRRRVAIKVLKKGMDTDEILHRFELERQLLAALNHPGIARLYDGGETAECLPFFVMEYVEGQPIDEYCDTHRLRIAERLELFRLVCSAVHYAHQNLIVHRDLKPGNILVTKDGVPKLLDFGIAKLINPELSLISGDPTAPELRVMTPEYASPEQARGDPITTASDVYALGVLLYEMVTGHRPYRIRSRIRAEIERVICEVEPERPSTAISRVEELLPEEISKGATTTITPERVSKVREGRPDRLRKRLAGDIDNIVLMAMRKEPQRRYKSAEQFADDIQRHLAGLPVIARRDTFGYRCAKFMGRHRTGVAAAAAFVLLLVGGISTTSWQASVAAAERDVAERERTTAQQQRDLAQNMFDRVRELARIFMFDFHDAIQELDGSVPARQLLVTTALAYLDGLADEAGDDPELKRELSAAYDRVGDIRGGIRNPSLGDTSGALESYGMALDLRRDLIAEGPQDLQLRKELATSHMKVGDLLLQQGGRAAALHHYREALSISEALAAADLSHLPQVAMQLDNVGKALSDMGLLEQARQHYERSLQIRRQVVAGQPDEPTWRRRLSVGLNRVGEILAKLGDPEGALRHYQEALEIREQLAGANPDSGRADRDLALSQAFVAAQLRELGRYEEATAHLESGLPIFEARVQLDPLDARARRDLAWALLESGQVRLATGDSGGALERYRRSESIIAALAASDADNAQYRELEASCQERIAEALQAGADPLGAIVAYRRALEIASELSDAGTPDPRVVEYRARILSALGDVLGGTQTAEAQHSLGEAREIYASLRDSRPQSPSVRNGLATTLQRLSRLMAETGGAEAAIMYAEQALEIDGTRKPSLLRDLAVALDLAGERQRAVGIAREAHRRADSHELRLQLEADLERYSR